MSQASHELTVPPVKHLDLAPVMIIGHGSSGTSITGHLIRELLQVSFGTESQFIPRYFYRRARYGDLHNDANLRRLIGDILEERWFVRCRKFGFETDLESVLADIGDRTYRGVLDAVFRQLAKHNRMERWGDKTPEYIDHLPVLEAVFPDAYYIHIVRDGRDVALSVFDRFWGAKNIVTAALEWRHAIDRVREFAKTINPERMLDIRYEDLLSQPRQTFSKIIEFLKIEDADGRLLEYVDQEARKQLKSTNFNKWKTALTAKQQLTFDRINGDFLAEYGYETKTSEVRQPGSMECAFWAADSRVRQWGRLDYWKDDLYKLRLFSKELLRNLGIRTSRPHSRAGGVQGSSI